jgi:hypothetical protein
MVGRSLIVSAPAGIWRAYVGAMSSLVWLALVVVLAVGVALTGHGPKGAKPVAGTRLMKSARFFLIVGILVCGGLGVMGALRN